MVYVDLFVSFWRATVEPLASSLWDTHPRLVVLGLAILLVVVVLPKHGK